MAARMTPPVCASWCGGAWPKDPQAPDDQYPCKGDVRCREDVLHGLCRCSEACRVAGRPVNPAPVKPKRNGPCPACGGTGGEGEWFDGCEVRCVDCGVMLMCDVAKDDGPTVFRLMNEGATDADE